MLITGVQLCSRGQSKTPNHFVSHVSKWTRPSLLKYCASSLWIFKREWSKLQYFAERSSCRLIQGVGIKSLSFPVLDSESPGALRESVENVETAFEYCEEELKKCFCNALSSLTTVRTVRCVSHELFLNAVFCNFCP